MTKVYGVPVSPYVRKVLLALEYKGVAYDLDPLMPINLPAEFGKVSPLMKIPAFEDDLVTLADSTVISEYLDDRYSEKSLRGKCPVERSRARWFETYAGDKLIQVLHVGLFVERIVKPNFLSMPTDEEQVQKVLAEDVPPVFAYLDAELAGKEYLVGDSVTIADFAVVSHFISAKYAGVDVDATAYPNLAAYLDRMYSLPVIAGRMDADAAMMANAA